MLLRKFFNDRGLSTAVGDEGGFAPVLEGTEDALNSILSAIKAAGYEPGKGCNDCFWTALLPNFIKTVFTTIQSLKVLKVPKEQQTSKLFTCLNWFLNILSTLSRTVWMKATGTDGRKKLTTALGSKCRLVGDDLFVTNVDFLKKN